MKDSTGSVKLNMLMSALLTLSSVIFPLITLPYVGRVLGPQGVGKVYFASSVVMTFAMISELGIPVYGIRACARVRDDRDLLSRTVHEIMMINIAACAVVYVLFGAAAAFVPRFASDRRMLIIMSSVMILNAIGAEWLYKALEKYAYITIRSILFKIIALALLFMLVRSDSDYEIYGYLTIFAASASNILNFINLRKYVSLRPSGPFDYCRHLPVMMIFFALAATTTIYTNMDLAVLDFLTDDVQAGLYGVSVRVKLVIVSIVTSVSSVLLPRNSFYYSKGRNKDFFSLLSATMAMLIIVAVPVSLYFILFAGESIELLAGSGFEGAASAMRVIMPSVVFIGISNIIGMQMLVPAGHEKDVVKAAAWGAMIDLVLNFILIPCYASAGAAAATLAAEMAVTGIILRSAEKAGPIDGASEHMPSPLNELFRGIPLKRILIALALSLAASLWVKAVPAGAFVKLAMSAICFFGVYFLIIFAVRRNNGLLHRD